MEIFSEPDYYPSPSSTVILYSNQSVTKARHAVSQADIYALIVYLSSPVDPVSYPIFSDFFLVYREFISPINLYHLLIRRFEWCISEINQEDGKRSNIGSIALVRTFVFIRHGILNHFVEDFLSNVNLRLLFIEFLNRDYLNSTKIVKNCIVNLKKIWIHCLNSTWDNVTFNEPINLTEYSNEDLDRLWLEFKIKDITQLNNEMKRASRLSAATLEGISSPDFRNRSVMSLYKDQENFQLATPEDTKHLKKQSHRTPSMLLNPESNFNYAARVPSGNSLNDQNIDNKVYETAVTKTPNSSNENIIDKPVRRKVSVMSRLPSNMSPTIADLEYPRNSKIDKIIPPTPAKKIEIILNSNYVPQGEPIPNTNKNKNNKLPGRSNSILSYSSNYLGPMALLNKWKLNHSRNKKNVINSPYKRNNSENNTSQVGKIVKPQMDTFVKYVISISSLDKHNQDSNETINLDSSKFDILSARTIDQVEFLLNLENNLLEKVNDMKDDHVTISTQEIDDNNDEDHINLGNCLPKPVNNFSAMDNLDLYQTVSSIAQSVISLSNTLNMTSTDDGAGIIAPLSSRRQVKSSTAVIFAQSNNSSRLILENPNLNERILENSPQYADGPQRLIFHSISNESSSRPSSTYSNLTNSTPTKVHRSPIRKRSSSPLKKMLADVPEVDNKETSLEVINPEIPSLIGEVQEAIEPEYVSYDSDFSTSNHSMNHDDHNDSTLDTGPNLKKKSSFGNLREFTFENSSKNMHSSRSIPELRHPTQQLNDSLDVITALYGSGDTINGSTTTTASSSLQSEAREDISSLQNINKPADSNNPYQEPLAVAGIRPASGRISLIKRNTVQSNKRKTASPLSSINVNITHTDFYQKDKLLQESEKKLMTLEEKLGRRDSATPSIATATLFTSRMNSPRKGLQAHSQSDVSVNPRVRLSIQPSIQSIISDGTFLSYSTFESEPDKRVSLRSKFQEGIAGNSGPQFETASTNKYIFEPDSESIDGTSPAKDMEELKSKFLKKEDIKSPLKEDTEPSIYDGSPQKNISQRLNEEALKNIADITDDTIQDDPVKVAMMKLEGTYVKTKHTLVTESSPEISKVSKEIEMLNISNVLSIPITPQEKRKSLLIQRRRQTIMNIPYTPPVVNNEDSTNPSFHDMNLIKPDDIQKLLADYEIHDPNLSISNNEHHIPFILTYDSLSIARQMTLIEKELLCEIDWKDLLDLKIRYNGPSVTSWLQLLVRNESLSGVDLAIARFNLTVDWIISEIAITRDVKLRRNAIQRFIHVAEHCRKFQNFNTLMQIVLALNSVVVQKFIDGWRLIEPGDLLTWEELKKIASLDRNYAAIRNLLNHVDPLKGCIPFIVVYLSDLSINSEKRTWIEQDKIINYNKFDTTVQIVKHFIQRVQWCKHYDFEVDHELLSKCIYLTALSQDEIHQLSTTSPSPPN